MESIFILSGVDVKVGNVANIGSIFILPEIVVRVGKECKDVM